MISLEECKERVKSDLEEQMGITDLLKGKLSKAQLNEIEKIRKDMESEINIQAEALYRWLNR